MFLGLLLLLPLAAEGSILGKLICMLPDPTKELLNITTANKTWYGNYQYTALPGMSSLAGCIVVNQSPGVSDNEIKLHVHFSKHATVAFNGTGTYQGNRLIVNVNGPFTTELNGAHNVVWSDEEIFIEHFCSLSTKMANIMTIYKSPSNEVIERVWKIVEEHSEIDRKMFSKVDC